MKYLKTPHVWGLSPENYHDRNHCWREDILLMVPTQEKLIFSLNLHMTELRFLTCAMIIGIQMGEMPKLG
jgi:hypothetical protein